MTVNFTLEIRDDDEGRPLAKKTFVVSRIEELCELIGIRHYQNHATYDLDAGDVIRLSETYDLNLIPSNLCDMTRAICTLRVSNHLDQLPYLIHTNYELYLMLSGTKPLAVFSAACGDENSDVIPEIGFDRYVSAGRFTKREFVQLAPHGNIRMVLYSLPIEEWRIDSYILLLQVAAKTGWNEGFERIEGLLLGYEEWQCDAYLQSKKLSEGPITT